MKQPARIVTVTVKCIGCNATREVHVGEVPDNDMPMCGRCGNPMIATGAKTTTKTHRAAKRMHVTAFDRVISPEEAKTMSTKVTISVKKLAGMQERLDADRCVIDRLEESLKTGVLLGNFNEPLDMYGKRLLRVILVEFDRAIEASGQSQDDAPAK